MLLHASLTGMKIFMMIGAVVISRENLYCHSSIHELPKPYIAPPPRWLSHLLFNGCQCFFSRGLNCLGDEAYHLPPFNDETKNVSVFHVHLERAQGQLYTLFYLMLYVRVYFSCEGPRSRCYGRTAALMLIVQTCDEDD
jgi:hypothetical protein